ncbi:MAG TPA: protein kinase [Streptosporangiaceae bacterium]
MPPKPLQPGDPARLGRFELLGRLGEGGQGIVYLGRGPDPGEDRVAVKVLRSTADADVLERLARELDAIHQVQPFVTAGVIEASAEGERRYVVSEFIDGPSLQERVDERGPLPEGDLQRLAVGTATALTAIHGAGVVHRDFKPTNVLLGPDGPRVVDFGIARLTDASTITSGLIGTPSYVAPEQLSGARPTSAVDIFAWAVTLIYAATGRLAFGADSVSAVMHRILYEEPDVNGLPPSLRAIARECLDKDPGRRPSARDLLLRLVDPSAQRAAAAAPVPPAMSGPPTWGPGSGPPPLADSPPPGWAAATGPVYPAGGPTAPGGYPSQPSVPASPSQPYGPGSPGPRFRRGLILAASGVVIVAVALGALLLARGPASEPPATADSRPATSASHLASPAATQASQPASPAATQTTRATPSSGARIPASFAGTWSGTATMAALGDASFGLKNTISFTFAAGGRTAHEIDQDCVNTLTLTRATAAVMVFSEPGTAACVAGTVTFTRHGSELAYRWTDNIEQNTAVLRRS